MRGTKGIVAFLAFYLILVGSTAVGAQGLKHRELLGVRLGGAVSLGALHDAFGNGSELELHFIKGLMPWLGVDVTLSSHSFGASRDINKNIEFVGRPAEIDLHMYSIAAGAVALVPLNSRMMLSFEAGPGLYSVNTVLPEGFFEVQRTDNRFGLYGGVGTFFKITNSFMLNANGKFHHVFVGSGMDDTIHFYTGQTSVQFYQIAVGVAIFTG